MSNIQPQLLLRAKLYDALKSGKYHQARGYYRKVRFKTYSMSYCFLGLAYHIMGGQRWDGHFHDELEEAYGFNNTTTLILMNDVDGCSFNEFASLIDNHPEFIYS